MNTNETYIDHSQYTAKALIWGDDDAIDPDDVYIAPNPTLTRIKPPTQVSNPLYMNLDNLEGFQEIEQAKKRERIDMFKSRNW